MTVFVPLTLGTGWKAQKGDDPNETRKQVIFKLAKKWGF